MEVEKIMFEMYNAQYVREMDKLSNLYEEDIAFGRDAGLTEEQIKEVLIRRHGLTPVYAQNLLDCEPSNDAVLAL